MASHYNGDQTEFRRVPKLDAFAVTMRRQHADICYVAESWLHNDIPDQVLAMNCYPIHHNQARSQRR